MFFEAENFSAQLFLINRFTSGARGARVKARQFSALALRTCGEATFHCADGTSLVSRAGDVLYLPHGLAYDAAYTDMEVLAIHFWDTSEGNTAENFTPRSDSIALLFEKAHRLWEIGTPVARMEATALFYRILAALAANAPTSEDGESTAFSRAVELLTREYRDPDLSFPAVCERAGLSESAFRRKFCARYGKPPVRFLAELRLSEAQRRLISTQESVEEIALACGFRDVKYFSRVVKRHFGCTPSELRFI
ncbi:MAG: helix-turn-helix transcriptional regulator [Clostridia bacterium]|nr:helix-turn-helix transcriptional regulator [Clostridia bacterium]MBQ9774310.1 helix-turn-helix transcriptional regulator [Clostridia bacterium]